MGISLWIIAAIIVFLFDKNHAKIRQTFGLSEWEFRGVIGGLILALLLGFSL